MRYLLPILGGMASVAVVLGLSFSSSPAQSKAPAITVQDELQVKIRDLEERINRMEAKMPEFVTTSPEVVPFGDVVVNLFNDRSSRYLRCKIALKIDPARQKDVFAAVLSKKAETKNWLVAYLADQTLESVKGRQGQDRIRAEIKQSFGKILFPNQKANLIQEVLFEEFIIQ